MPPGSQVIVRLHCYSLMSSNTTIETTSQWHCYRAAIGALPRRSTLPHRQMGDAVKSASRLFANACLNPLHLIFIHFGPSFPTIPLLFDGLQTVSACF